ncbi:GrpB family protein [Parvibaculaceae bacterium PLY_AMNH_Bact1]|nr:GrpB family protein [Parvibaculaceae bacterium PLY_AMNH_Bact1]
MADKTLSDAAQASLNKHAADPVALAAHDNAWADQFEKLALQMKTACGDKLVTIHHIGSTSVPGLAAKPLIDMMPELRHHEEGPALAPLLEPLGFIYFGAYGIDGRHFFRRKGDVDVNVHMFETGHIEIERHVVFRDALRSDTKLLEAYQALKEELAARFPNDVDSYARSKSDFIESVLRELGAPERPGGPDK